MKHLLPKRPCVRIYDVNMFDSRTCLVFAVITCTLWEYCFFVDGYCGEFWWSWINVFFRHGDNIDDEKEYARLVRTKFRYKAASRCWSCKGGEMSTLQFLSITVSVQKSRPDDCDDDHLVAGGGKTWALSRWEKRASEMRGLSWCWLRQGSIVIGKSTTPRNTEVLVCVIDILDQWHLVVAVWCGRICGSNMLITDLHGNINHANDQLSTTQSLGKIVKLSSENGWQASDPMWRVFGVLKSLQNSLGWCQQKQ